jgi:hypothetical protein
MNVTTTQPLTGGIAQGMDAPSSALAVPQAASGGAGGYDDGFTAGLQSGAQAASAGIQTAASYVQTVAGYVGQVKDLLQQMAGLSTMARNSTGEPRADAEAGFAAAQEELRGIVGGSSVEAGSAGGAQFNGTDVFGGSAGNDAIGAGLAFAPSLAESASNLNLSQGALGSLIGQDSSGDFLAGAADPGTAAAISGALQQASFLSAAVNELQERVEAAVFEWRGMEDGTTPAITTPLLAAQQTQGAAGATLALGGAAAAVYSNLPSQSSLGLLQAGQG